MISDKTAVIPNGTAAINWISSLNNIASTWFFKIGTYRNLFETRELFFDSSVEV